MGRLTTHVLDTAHGRPAAGVRVALYRCDTEPALLAERVTDADGRCAPPLLEGALMCRGRYELVFAIGDYFAAQGVALDDPRFLDEAVLRFGIADPGRHYHVPLLAAPYAFSTYRGS